MDTTERQIKIKLLVLWLTDMINRVEDADDQKIIKDTINFLNNDSD